MRKRDSNAQRNFDLEEGSYFLSAFCNFGFSRLPYLEMGNFVKKTPSWPPMAAFLTTKMKVELMTSLVLVNVVKNVS